MGLDDIIVQSLPEVKDRIYGSDKSKYIMYKQVNRSLVVHDVYSRELGAHIPEYMRISFSRLRLSAYRLKIETGRWSRLPRDQRPP